MPARLIGDLAGFGSPAYASQSGGAVVRGAMVARLARDIPPMALPEGVREAFVVAGTPHHRPGAEGGALALGPVFGMLLAVYGSLFLPAMVISTLVTSVLDEPPRLKVPSAIFEDWVMRVSNESVTACLLAAFYGLARTQSEVLLPLGWRSDDPAE